MLNMQINYYDSQRFNHRFRSSLKQYVRQCMLHKFVGAKFIHQLLYLQSK